MTEDEKLQESIEKNSNKNDTLDSKAYQKIFAALEKEPYQIPFGFADRVMQRIEVKQKGVSPDLIWMIGGIAFLMIACVATALWLKFSFDFGAFKFISGYRSLILFGILLIAGFHWADKAIIQKRFHS